MIRKYLVCLILSLVVAVCWAQNQNENSGIDELIEAEDSKREEIQRYFGYDELTTNYITLPYDTSVGTNLTGRFVDIGYWLFALLPVLILAFSWRSSKRFYMLMLGLTFYLLFCISFSKIWVDNGQYVVGSPAWAELAEKKELSFTQTILYGVQSLADMMFSGIKETINNTKGLSPIAYPICILLFAFTFYQILRSQYSALTYKASMMLFTIIGSLWLLFSGGIVWYGYLLLPIGILILGAYSGAKKETNLYQNLTHNLIVIALIGWVIVGLTDRISLVKNFQLKKTNPNIELNMFLGSLFPYTMGATTINETLDKMAPNVSQALDKVNRNDSLIYMVGTGYTYDIHNNVNRIFQDNLLAQYTQLANAYSNNKEQIMEILKTNGFKYIFVDLNTYTIDNTPERTLTKKFVLLMNSLHRNSKVELIATDRLVSMGSGEYRQNVHDIVGDKILYQGTYAIYEIL